MKKQYTLFAGVNGAGKTSMYRARNFRKEVLLITIAFKEDF